MYKIYKLANNLYKAKVPFIPKIIKICIRIIFGCVIPYKAEIGEGTVLGYQGLAIVIHERAKIGKNCVVSQGVTIGGTSKKYDVPSIGNNVYIGAGAKIIGPITIGDDVVIGANAVVVNDIPSRCVIGGIPAKIIKKDINIENYK